MPLLDVSSALQTLGRRKPTYSHGRPAVCLPSNGKHHPLQSLCRQRTRHPIIAFDDDDLRTPQPPNLRMAEIHIQRAPAASQSVTDMHGQACSTFGNFRPSNGAQFSSLPLPYHPTSRTHVPLQRLTAYTASYLEPQAPRRSTKNPPPTQATILTSTNCDLKLERVRARRDTHTSFFVSHLKNG